MAGTDGTNAGTAEKDEGDAAEKQEVISSQSTVDNRQLAVGRLKQWQT